MNHDTLVTKFQHGVIHQIEKLAREAGLPADTVVERACQMIAKEAVAAIQREAALGKDAEPTTPV